MSARGFSRHTPVQRQLQNVPLQLEHGNTRRVNPRELEPEEIRVLSEKEAPHLVVHNLRARQRVANRVHSHTSEVGEHVKTEVNNHTSDIMDQRFGRVLAPDALPS